MHTHAHMHTHSRMHACEVSAAVTCSDSLLREFQMNLAAFKTFMDVQLKEYVQRQMAKAAGCGREEGRKRARIWAGGRRANRGGGKTKR